jgi:hypothetical protein
MTTAYPLSWPEGFPRTTKREAGRFKTSLPAALKNVQDSLRLFGSDSGRNVGNIILSSNVTLGVAKPADPGVAAWFLWDGEQRCIPVDRYQTVEGNLQAIHHIVEARRVELRHGTLALVRASFKGFTPTLPAPRRKTWREALELDTVPADRISPETIEHAHRRLMKTRHPDLGGSTEAAAELNAARTEGLKEIGHG